MFDTLINPQRAGTELSRLNYVNIMAADALAPYVARTSAPWYSLYRICRSLSYLRTALSTCVISMWRDDTKYKYMFMFTLKNLARKG